MNVYIVMGSYGEYSDRVEWPIKAYLRRRDADAHVERCDKERASFSVSNTLGDGRDLWEIVSGLSSRNGWYGYEIDTADGRREHRQFRRALAKLGIDVPNDPFVRSYHIGQASWYVMGPVELVGGMAPGSSISDGKGE